MIRASILDDVFAGVIQRVTDAFSVFGDYVFVGELWAGVAILALAAGYVAFFVPWQWLRGVLGFAVAMAIAFAAGAQTMFHRVRGVTKAERERAREAEKKRMDEEQHGGRWF